MNIRNLLHVDNDEEDRSLSSLCHIHRTFCCAVSDLRSITKKLNILNYVYYRSIIPALVEEIQFHGNAMESALDYGRDMRVLKKKRAKLIAEVKELEAKKEELQPTSNQEEEI